MANYMQCFLKISRQSVQAFNSYRPETQNCSNTQQNANFPKKMASGGHLGFRKMPKKNSAQWQSTGDVSWKFQGNRSRRSRVIVRKPKRRRKKKNKTKNRQKHIGIRFSIGMPNNMKVHPRWPPAAMLDFPSFRISQKRLLLERNGCSYCKMEENLVWAFGMVKGQSLLFWGHIPISKMAAYIYYRSSPALRAVCFVCLFVCLSVCTLHLTFLHLSFFTHTHHIP